MSEKRKGAHPLVQIVVGLAIGILVAMFAATLFNVSEASRAITKQATDDANTRTTAPGKVATNPK